MNREKINKLIMKLTKGTNYVERFNELDLEYTDKTIDVIADHEAFRYEVLDKLYLEVYQLQSEIDATDIENILADELIEKLKYWTSKNGEQMKEYSKLTKEIYSHFKESGKTIQGFYNEVEDRMFAYVDERTDFTKYYKRLHTLSQKFIHMAVGLQMNMLGHDGQIIRTLKQLMELKTITEKKISNESEEQISELLRNFKEKHKSRKYKKIFDYKDMIREAENNGYERYRQGATSHIVFRHIQSGKPVVIPTHSLKYGLMLQIQREIQANKVA